MRLLQKIVGALAHRCDRERHISVCSEQDNGNVRMGTLQLAHEIHAGFARHLEICQDDRRRLAPDREQCGVRIRSRFDGEPPQFEPLRNRVAYLLFIIDDEDCGIHVWIATAGCGARVPASGRTILNVVPRSTALSRVISPPMSWMIP